MPYGKASSGAGIFAISDVNGWDRQTFVRIIGPVFEHSPWIAEETWAKRPFRSAAALHQALCETVAGAHQTAKLSLIRAHPNLADRMTLASTLTAASTQEQASAGLDQLTPDEAAAFQNYNQAYREKFKFPFVICARLNKKEAILEGFRARLDHTVEQEIKIALEEIGKIAQLRLADLIEGP